MTLHHRPARLKRVVIPVPAGLTVRQMIEAQIEALIARLDAMDPDPDLEENGDREPSLGTCVQGVVDAEWDPSDDEPSLGACEGQDSQLHWLDGGELTLGYDLEEDMRVAGKPRRQMRGYPGEIFQVERAEKTRVVGELQAILGRHVTGSVTRDAAVRP